MRHTLPPYARSALAATGTVLLSSALATVLAPVAVAASAAPPALSQQASGADPLISEAVTIEGPLLGLGTINLPMLR
ncbi:hypothetical protein AB0L74_08005 [Streptomyces sp. NPDC052020]|uniref:hypothetical protein n=1 Tax=Streptomyces sp. NPDC052020 TaxID=3155677 RepID=UPI00342EA442